MAQPGDLIGGALDILDPPAWQPEDRAPLEPHQQPPPGDWSLWLLMAGRGAGKTEACSRYFARYMRSHPGSRGRIIAPTFGDAVESCISGPSGLQAMDPDVRWQPTAPGGAKVAWPNGSEAVVIGTPTAREVERLRAAGNRHIDWWEEMAANPMLAEAWDQAQLGLRLGDRPHTIASTTPRTRPKLRQIIADERTVVTRATSDANPHLSQRWRDELERAYGGTRLARQEIGGELLEDVEGALWTLALLDHGRVDWDAVPDLVRVVVGVDPSGGAGEQGIVVAGIAIDGHCYVLDDRSCQLSPRGWGQRAVKAFDDWKADRIIVERNFGGDMAEATVAGVDHEVPVDMVTASRGKALRAEPVANLYGDPDDVEASRPRVHHVRGADLAQLEDQQTTWTPFEGWSPDRLDALVWAITALMFTDPAERMFEYDPEDDVEFALT